MQYRVSLSGSGCRGHMCPAEQKVFRQLSANNQVSRDESERILMEMLN